MKFLVLCPYLPFDPDHGGRIRSGMLLRALRELGDVAIAAPVEEGQDVVEIAAAAGVLLHALAPRDPRTSVGQKIGHWLRRRSDVLERRWSAEARRQVKELIDVAELDAIVVDSTFALPLLPSRIDVPFVLHLHNVESAIFTRGTRALAGVRESVVRGIEGRMLAGLEGHAARRAALSIVVSELERQLLLQLAPEAARVEVVENAVDLERMPLLPPPAPPPEGAPRLLFVGSFDYPPNLEAVRELVSVHLPVLRARYPGLVVEVVGRDEEGDVAVLARDAGVEVRGFLDDLRPSYEEATAVYLPIRTGGGTRLKALEAFAYGRTVLSTHTGVEGLGVVEGEHYLSCESPDDGLRSLQRVLEGSAALIVRAARQLVEQRFDQQLLVGKLRDVIASALR